MNDYELKENVSILEDANTEYRKEILRHKNLLLLKADTLKPQTFEKEFIDLIVTSPPYNVGIEYNSNNDELNYENYLEFSKTWLENCYQWSKPQARLCMNIPLDKNKGGHRAVGADLTKIAQEVGWQYKTTIIWNEGNISRRTAWGSWKSASAPVVIAPVELIVVMYKDQWKKTNGSKINDVTGDEFKTWTQGVWVFNGESKKRIGHPAPFPKELPYRCIKLFSYQNDLVFDPFAGSGTSLIVAQNLERKAIGLEIDKDYCELAKHRILKEISLLDFNNEEDMAKKVIQADLIKEFFKKNPLRDIKHPEVVDWASAEYEKRTGEKFRDPDRAIRKLAQQGFLIKVKKGVYKYDPDLEHKKELEDFTQVQKEEILKRDGYKCVICGKGKEDGVELQVDHIKPKDKGGKATIENGQTLCGQHNYMKKNLNQTETGKKMFIRLFELAKEKKDNELQEFCKDILDVFDKHNINGHIEWKK